MGADNKPYRSCGTGAVHYFVWPTLRLGDKRSKWIMRKDDRQGLIPGWDPLRAFDDEKLGGGFFGYQLEPELLLQSPLPDSECVAAWIRLDIHADVIDPFDAGFIHYGNCIATCV